MTINAPRVAVGVRLFPESITQLQQAGFHTCLHPYDQAAQGEQLVALAKDAQALLISASSHIDATLLKQLPNLKMIANIGVGYNNIDMSAAQARGVIVSNTPDVLTETTADMAWALMFAAARRITESERWLRAGHWRGMILDDWLGMDIHGSTLGIIGMGRIGRAIARRAQGFNMRVLYHNRHPITETTTLHATWVEKNTLLAEADHLILVVPYSAQTHHLIGAKELAQMKSSAVLVNIARGGVVDDKALAHALKSGQIAAAGLDVYENEPDLNPDLLELPNAVLTPHIGSASKATRLGMVNLAVQNLFDWQAGKAPRNQVII